MNRQILALILFVVTAFTGTGCDKAATIQKLENIADELRVYNRNIALANNQAFRDQKISAAFHLNVNKTLDGFSKALDGTDAAIKAAKTVTDKTEMRSRLDFIQRLLDTEVFAAFADIVEAVTDFPPDIKARIEAILASIRLAFTTIRTLFADARIALKEETANA